MLVTRERLESGLTYEQFKAQMTRNRERLELAEGKVDLTPADVAALAALPAPLDVLVLAEDWCGDVIANLPVLARLADASGKLRLHILLRDQNLDVMDEYLNQGKYRSIPVFVFFDPSDEGLREVGRFVERPASVTALRAERRREFLAQHPELGAPDTPPDQLSEAAQQAIARAMMAIREETTPFANAEVVREIRGIVERAKG